MGHVVRVLADSVSPDRVRLTTLEVTFPRIVLAELNTHRMFSRNSASSRAIPVEKMIQRVLDDPYVPAEWGRNQKGMQAGEAIYGVEAQRAVSEWLHARDSAVAHARQLLEIGIHKQWVNRLLEPWLWHTVIVTATEWNNFFHLRCNEHAHPDIRRAAELMRGAMAESTPKDLTYNDWHLPLVYDEDYEHAILQDPTNPPGVMNKLVQVSVGRCARVSYLTHDGKRDFGKDVELHDQLLENGHMSPFEHVARPMTPKELEDRCRWHVLLDDGRTVTTSWGGPYVAPDPGFVLYVVEHRINSTEAMAAVLGRSRVKEVLHRTSFEGNFNGWIQYRKTIPFEWDVKQA